MVSGNKSNVALINWVDYISRITVPLQHSIRHLTCRRKIGTWWDLFPEIDSTLFIVLYSMEAITTRNKFVWFFYFTFSSL